MCGITGFVAPTTTQSHDSLTALATKMNDSLRHRGPESGGVWVEAEAGIGLGHRRLAILDCTPAGAQPMVSKNEQWVLSYNGEIYNHAELKEELRANGHKVKGGGDTAVLLAALAAWGVAATLPKLNGMFAFALWNKTTRTLTLARDRLGIKPLYWALAQGNFLFGSELRALRQHPACPREIDPQALAQYFRSGNVPAPASIIAGVQKLAPATYLTFSVGAEPILTRYWDVNQIALTTPTTQDDFTTATTKLRALLDDTIKRQMLADVPLGTLLSGGIDSTLVTAIAQTQSKKPLTTFSIGFEQDGMRGGDLDEAPFAKAIAAHLGTDHHETYVTTADAQAIIPLLPDIYDEPFADSSQIPTYLVAKIARQHVTVALSGDGGDEGFLGYNRYRAWENLERYPAPMVNAAVAMAGLLSAEKWNQLGALLPAKIRVSQLGDKLTKLTALKSGEVADVYRNLTEWWPYPEALLQADITPLPVVLPYPVPDDPVATMQLWDQLGYLPDDVLTKVDRASMAVALEVRVPLLDHRVIEYGWSLPRDYKLQQGITKRILRAVLEPLVPIALLDRPKAGFGVPLAAWLRGALREWAETLLSETRLSAAGLMAEPIRAVWAAHLSGRSNHQNQLWAVLMYVAWHEQWQSEA